MHDIPDDRNIATAEDEWDSGIRFDENSSTHALIEALLSQTNRIDDELDDIYHQQHIDTATGGQLERIGDLVDVQRQSGESDEKLRSRIKAEFAQGTADATFDDFVEFTAAALNTSVQNITLRNDYPADPATVSVIVDANLFDNTGFTVSELAELFGGGVPAGHEVKIIERGTFRVKTDGTSSDADKGLTSDSITTGGTLSSDAL